MAGFRQKLGPGTGPTAPAWKTLHKSMKIKPGDGLSDMKNVKVGRITRNEPTERKGREKYIELAKQRQEIRERSDRKDSMEGQT